MDWIERSLTLLKRHGGSPPNEVFAGRWDERHPLNVPGRFYGAATDTCCDGPPIAPASLLYDHKGCGFIWRQPRNERELKNLLDAAESDPFSGYAQDGDEHWTTELVRTWWMERHERLSLVEALVRDVAGPRPELPTEGADLLFRCLPIGGYTEEERAGMRGIVTNYLDYLDNDMAGDLRRYIAFLETGAEPASEGPLPQL